MESCYVEATLVRRLSKRQVEKAKSLGITVLDTVQDYGLGKCQPIIGRVADKQVYYLQSTELLCVV